MYCNSSGPRAKPERKVVGDEGVTETEKEQWGSFRVNQERRCQEASSGVAQRGEITMSETAEVCHGEDTFRCCNWDFTDDLGKVIFRKVVRIETSIHID